jgi:hypothetical protein
MGHLLKIKSVDSRVNVNILAATSVPFTLSTAQVPNLALTHKKRITVNTSTVTPNVTHPFQRPSLDFSERYSENFGNFLGRLTFSWASTFLYVCKTLVGVYGYCVLRIFPEERH